MMKTTHAKKTNARVLTLLVAVILAVTMIFPLTTGNVCAASPYLNVRVLHMQAGQTFTLKLKHAKKVRWKSSNKKVARVSNGKVTALKAGSATITAKKGKKNYKCRVTVAKGDTKSLIIYFSATGNTKKAADKLQKQADADMVRIVPRKTYKKKDLNYNKDCRANSEQEKNKDVAIATKVRDLKQYDTIFLGYPIWWGKEPGVIRTFLKKNDLKGKTVLPFCTSGGSGISGSMPHIRSMAKSADVKKGMDLTDASSEEIRNWIEKNAAK